MVFPEFIAASTLPSPPDYISIWIDSFQGSFEMNGVSPNF